MALRHLRLGLCDCGLHPVLRDRFADSDLDDEGLHRERHRGGIRVASRLLALEHGSRGRGLWARGCISRIARPSTRRLSAAAQDEVDFYFATTPTPLILSRREAPSRRTRGGGTD